MPAPKLSTFELPTPPSSSHILLQGDEGTRPWRKRRLTAPADLQLDLAQIHKKPRITQASHGDNLKIDDVDELIPQFNNMGKDALYTPQTGGYDAAFVPFVFDDGELSFYTPPPGSDPNYVPSLPSSAVSQTFFRESSDEICSEPRQDSTDVQGLSIWRGGDEEPSHIYTHMVDRQPIRETTSLRKLDPSLVHYGPVHEAMTQFSCQFAHIDVPLTIPLPMDGLRESSNNSLITISSPRRNHIRLVTTLYLRGSRVSSHGVRMEESSHLNAATSLYSAPLPRELIDGVCRGLDREKSLPPNGPRSPPRDDSDYVAIMRFVQEPATGEEETLLVVAGKFYALQDSMPAKVKISDLIVEEGYSRELHLPQAILPTPPLSHEHFPKLPKSSRLRPSQILGRSTPRLSVSIPPPSMQGINGIQLCTDSPELAMRPTPRTGIPSNVYPVTPFEQLIRTPSHPPELSRSSARSLSSYAPTPSESAYPFTLASTSPGPAPSPAFGVLERGSALGSAPAWLTLPRNVTPFTPSFFIPHTAAASNAMSSLTQRAIDAGTPAVSSCKDEYFDPPPLAPPLPIVSPSQFLSSQDK